ncbi:helix-turn-helix domain-containing protein [Altererythrobacter lutimaris]|uniref:Helix-turn-helix domain-containing protein n=1 Tax=Altererythrobacter lutimaris TaxID=2743979 RepID=A0A850H998_9SPHN|nr:helix-turn-helix domain-containing protein [Altererythrobacter lutimaris]NVE93466.1 helix-turn-helix domain-containing protein [Altererythrobacter lutimaris]
MDKQTVFQTFMRSIFGQDPGGVLGTQLVHLSELVSVEPGQAARLDLRQDRVVYIARGATKLAALASHEREQIVAFQFAGDLVSIPRAEMHHYTVSALTSTTLLVFPAGQFLDCISRENDASRVVIERLRGALHRCRDKTVALGQKNALERVSSFLLAMAERVGGAELNSCTLELPMSRREIGDSLGLTIETVSRQFSALRDIGLIATRGRAQVSLLDLQKLTAISGRCADTHVRNEKNPVFDSDQGRAQSAELAALTTGGK